MPILYIQFLSEFIWLKCFAHYFFQLITNLVHREWQRHQRLHDVELPDITATKARKVATSTSREIGFSKEEQETLALNVMGHRKEPSDKYYDKSRKTSTRVAVTQKLRRHFKVNQSYFNFLTYYSSLKIKYKKIIQNQLALLVYKLYPVYNEYMKIWEKNTDLNW